MPEAVIINTRPSGRRSSGKFIPSTPAIAAASARWVGKAQTSGLRRSMPLPDNVVMLASTRPAADWPVPPHVLSMMHLAVQLTPAQAATVARQLAAIYAMSGDAFTDMAIKVLEANT
jgi:hypothetical protein